MKETLTTSYNETTWQIKETDIEKGTEKEWNIHQKTINYEYTAPAGDSLPSPDYQRKSLPSVEQLGIAQVAASPASLQQPRRALRKG